MRDYYKVMIGFDVSDIMIDKFMRVCDLGFEKVAQSQTISMKIDIEKGIEFNKEKQKALIDACVKAGKVQGKLITNPKIISIKKLNLDAPCIESYMKVVREVGVTKSNDRKHSYDQFKKQTFADIKR